jgi:hypothetical protein
MTGAGVAVRIPVAAGSAANVKAEGTDKYWILVGFLDLTSAMRRRGKISQGQIPAQEGTLAHRFQGAACQLDPA